MQLSRVFISYRNPNFVSMSFILKTRIGIPWCRWSITLFITRIVSFFALSPASAACSSNIFLRRPVHLLLSIPQAGHLASADFTAFSLKSLRISISSWFRHSRSAAGSLKFIVGSCNCLWIPSIFPRTVLPNSSKTIKLKFNTLKATVPRHFWFQHSLIGLLLCFQVAQPIRKVLRM